MVAQSVHERLRDPIEAVVGKVPAEQRHHPVFFRLTEQMRPVYPVAEQRSDPIGPFAVNGAPGTAQEQFGFRTHVQWGMARLFFTTENMETRRKRFYRQNRSYTGFPGLS